jgi:hypothetical protein
MAGVDFDIPSFEARDIWTTFLRLPPLPRCAWAPGRRSHLEEEGLVLEQLLHVVAPHGGALAVRERVHPLDAHPRQGGAHARQVGGAGRETGPPTPLVFGGGCNRRSVLRRGAGGMGQATEGAAFRGGILRRAYVDLAFQASVEGAVNLRD